MHQEKLLAKKGCIEGKTLARKRGASTGKLLQKGRIRAKLLKKGGIKVHSSALAQQHDSFQQSFKKGQVKNYYLKKRRSSAEGSLSCSSRCIYLVQKGIKMFWPKIPSPRRKQIPALSFQTIDKSFSPFFSGPLPRSPVWRRMPTRGTEGGGSRSQSPTRRQSKRELLPIEQNNLGEMRVCARTVLDLYQNAVGKSEDIQHKEPFIAFCACVMFLFCTKAS